MVFDQDFLRETSFIDAIKVDKGRVPDGRSGPLLLSTLALLFFSSEEKNPETGSEFGPREPWPLHHHPFDAS
jgi:hypothetical protein